MNKRIFRLISIAFAVLVTFSFSSCKKDLNVNTPAIPVAGLMAFNVIPDNGAVGFSISGNPLTNYPLLFDREGKPKPAFFSVINAAK